MGGSFAAAADPGPLGAAVIHDGVLGCHPRSHVLVGHVVGAGRIAAQKAGQRGLEERAVVFEVGVLLGGLEIEVLGVGQPARGELHIAILLENMRREGFELQVSQPHAILKEINGVLSEPYEEVTVDVPQDFQGIVIEKLGKRKGIMKDMKIKDNQVRMLFEIPTRGLLGYRGSFIVDTKGLGILCSRFIDFRPYAGEIQKQEFGSMTCMVTGKTMAFSLWNLQERGVLYINPAVEIYEGMVIGHVSNGEDLEVNPTKNKALSNMRTSGNDEALYLIPPLRMNIERGMEIMQDDEYLEITPINVRLRKKLLTNNDRQKAKRK